MEYMMIIVSISSLIVIISCFVQRKKAKEMTVSRNGKGISMADMENSKIKVRQINKSILVAIITLVLAVGYLVI